MSLEVFLFGCFTPTTILLILVYFPVVCLIILYLCDVLFIRFFLLNGMSLDEFKFLTRFFVTGQPDHFMQIKDRSDQKVLG